MADYLKECMSDVSGKLGKVVPINEFNQAFCVLCVNKECSRSQSNNLSIVRRSLNWHKNLFTNIPRANENDPQYDGIRSKKFISINSPTNTSTLNTPKKPSQNLIEQKLNIEFKSETKPQETKPQETKPQETKPQETKPQPQIRPLDLGNTPFTQGVVLPKKKEVFLKPGQSYTFESNDKNNKA